MKINFHYIYIYKLIVKYKKFILNYFINLYNQLFK